MGRICAQCSHYVGGGDFGLCCTIEAGLWYEDSPAEKCKTFKQNTECKNVSSYVGMFRCSICGSQHHECLVGDNCPDCGSEITGGIWQKQKHWRKR